MKYEKNFNNSNGMYLFMGNTSNAKITNENILNEEYKQENNVFYEKDNNVTVYLFKNSTCPHFKAAYEYFSNIVNEYPYLEVKVFELIGNADNGTLYNKVAEEFNTEEHYVPYIIIGDVYHKTGYSSNTNKALIKAITDAHTSPDYKDVVSKVIENNQDLDLKIETLKGNN